MKALRQLFVFAALVAVGAAFVRHDDPVSTDRHLRLLKSDPAADATLESAPAAIHLWFSEEPAIRVTTIQLTTAGQTRKLEDVTADAEDGKHVIAAIDSTTTAGAWTVAWRTMSRDGHVVSGDIAFEVRPQR